VGEEARGRKEVTETVKRRTAAVFIAIGLIVGGVGWALLPHDEGRYAYVVAVVDPRPLPEAEMPAGLTTREVTRLHAFIPLTATIQAARVITLTRPRAAEGPAKVAMVENLSKYIKSSDCQLGRMEPGVAAAAAGAATGLLRGPVELGSHRTSIAGLLEPLGPLFDDALWIESSPSLADPGPLPPLRRDLGGARPAARPAPGRSCTPAGAGSRDPQPVRASRSLPTDQARAGGCAGSCRAHPDGAARASHVPGGDGAEIRPPVILRRVPDHSRSSGSASTSALATTSPPA
jgi:hypothetical protein